MVIREGVGEDEEGNSRIGLIATYKSNFFSFFFNKKKNEKYHKW